MKEKKRERKTERKKEREKLLMHFILILQFYIEYMFLDVSYM